MIEKYLEGWEIFFEHGKEFHNEYNISSWILMATQEYTYYRWSTINTHYLYLMEAFK